MGRLRAVAVQPKIQSLIFSDQIFRALRTAGPRQVAALRNHGREFIRLCLREGVDKGLLRQDLDVEGAVILVTGMVMGFLYAAKDGALPAPVGQMQRRSWQTLRPMLERGQVTP